MKNSQAREAILSRIQEALRVPVSKPFAKHTADEIYIRPEQPLLETFITEFEALQGQLVLCPDKEAVQMALRELAVQRGWGKMYCQAPALAVAYDLGNAPFFTDKNPGGYYPAITDCEVLIARTGTMVLSAAQPSGRALPVHTPVHIVIGCVGQLVYDIKDGIERMQAKYGQHLPSALFFTSGPSRTGDIEKTLVMGVHGPIEVYILLRTDQ